MIFKLQFLVLIGESQSPPGANVKFYLIYLHCTILSAVIYFKKGESESSPGQVKVSHPKANFIHSFIFDPPQQDTNVIYLFIICFLLSLSEDPR